MPGEGVTMTGWHVLGEGVGREGAVGAPSTGVLSESVFFDCFILYSKTYHNIMNFVFIFIIYRLFIVTWPPEISCWVKI